MKYLYWLLLVNAALPFAGYAQTSPLRFQSLSLSDGLPHSIVNHATQDSQGFMWFSTHGGLSRYDGYAFKTFVPQSDDRNGLLYYEVEAAQEDAHQNLWIRYSAGGVSRYNMLTQEFSHYPLRADSGSVAGDFAANRNRENVMFVDRQDRVWFRTVRGLCRYDPTTDGFITYAHRSGDTTSLAGNHINYLMQDAQDRLWVAADGGLSRFDETTQTFVNYDVANSGLGHQSVLSLHEDKRHFLWVGTADGLSRSERPLGSSSLRFVTYRPVAQPMHHTNAIHQIVPHPDGSLWLTTNRGVVRADPSATGVAFQVYLNGPERLDVTGAHLIAAVYHDSQGTTWAHARPGKRGLFRYLPQENRFVSLPAAHQTHPPPTDAIAHIFEGQQDILWLCTERSGVLKVDLQAQPFVHYQPDSLLDNDAYAINRLGDRLWIGTISGLYAHHLPTGITKKIPYGDGNSRPDYPKIVGALAHDSAQHRLWIGYYDYKVSRLSIDDGSATHYHYRDNRTDRYRPWSVRTICQDASGRIWVGAVTGGLHYYHPESDRFYEYELPVANLRWIKALHLQADSLLWIGTMQQGAHRLNLRSGRLTSFDRTTTLRFPSDDVAAIASLAGRVWIGTAYGLAEIDAHDQVVNTYTTEDGLSGNNIKALVPDRQGRLWVSTNDGLSCFDPTVGTFSNYYTNDGLLSNEFNQGAGFADQQGLLYFGGSRGVTAFDPDLIKPTPTQAPLRMVDIQISNVSLNSGDTIQGRIPLVQNPTFTSKVVLPYRASNIMFQFATLNYRSPLASRYAYRLEGLDEQWNIADASHRRATYTNLSPGTYRFWVQDLHSTAPAASVEVTVLAPWWGTTWFRGLIGCLLIGLMVGWNRWRHGDLVRQRETLRQVVSARTASLQRQSHELLAANQALRRKQQEVAEQTRLMQQMAEAVHRSDQMKIRFFTQMSHEFRTPLTLILGPLQMGLSSKHLPRPVAQQLRLMKRNAERLFHLINQLIDLNRVEEGMMRLMVTEVDLVEETRRTVETFAPMVQQTGVALRYETATARHEGWLDIDKYDKILYNLLSNAFKFTPEGGQVRVSSRIESTPAGNFLCLSVRDSGVGVRPEDLPHLFDHFYTAQTSPPHQPGSGIGLALVKQLVTLHRGTIQVTSDSAGTAFSLRLPVGGQQFQPSEMAPPPVASRLPQLAPPAPLPGAITTPAPADSGKPLLLVVDDNPDMCTFVRLALTPRYEVVEAYDGEMAWERLANRIPALVISDVMMPRLDGIALCQRIKKHPATSPIPVILLTAKAAEEDEVTGLRCGACDYIRKPFSGEVLQLKVKNILATYARVKRQISRGEHRAVEAQAIHPSDRDFLDQVTALIDGNIAESTLTADFLADRLSLSKSHLYKKIKGLSGVSVHVFIRNQRIRAAAQLLQQGKRINEAAYGVGFSSQSYFTRCFSDFYGKSPRAYQAEFLLS